MRNLQEGKNETIWYIYIYFFFLSTEEKETREKARTEMKEWLEENKQIIARKLMSTLGPSQLFKPNDGDRKKEETEGSAGRVGKTRNKKGEGRETVLGIGATAQFAATISWYRLLSVPRDSASSPTPPL